MLLGLSGKMRTGKNTAADYLCAQYGFRQVAFADPIKRLAMEYFQLTHAECYGQKTDRSRYVLQKIGEYFRELDEDVWCRYTLAHIPQGQSTVISDVRFPNEVEMIRQAGGKIYRLCRTLPPSFGADHISETALDHYHQFDALVDNSGSVEALHESLQLLMKEELRGD